MTFSIGDSLVRAGAWQKEGVCGLEIGSRKRLAG